VLAHLVLVHPGTRLLPKGLLERSALVAAYAYAATTAVAGDDRATVVFAVVVVALAGGRLLAARGLERRGQASGALAAAILGAAAAFAATDRLFGLGVSERTVLALYDIAVAALAVLLAADLLFGRSARAAVTGLVVDLGAGGATLTERLSQTVGDPSLVVAYWLPHRDEYVDETGRAVAVEAGDGRAVTRVDEGSTPLAALVHDAAVLTDPELVSGVSAAVRLAVSNVRLQDGIRARAQEVDASRRRIVEAADEERRRLERDLRDGAQRRLAHVAALVSDDLELSAQLAAARAELGEFARGVHPAALTQHGLDVALRELAARSGAAIEVSVAEPCPPAIEAAAYFVCSEALANAAKYANASRVRVAVTQRRESLRIEVEDDGVGGADPAAGSGLRGLADRLEALGGRLRIESGPHAGTRVVGELPLEGRPQRVFVHTGENRAP
jgi:signal transduction histidine kinase